MENAIQEEADLCPIDNVHRVFRSILVAPSLDIRDKKAAIIDFIAAGIKTVGNSCDYRIKNKQSANYQLLHLNVITFLSSEPTEFLI